MRKLILRISITLDGFIESSTGKIDFAKSRSPEGAAFVAEKMAQAGAHLLGRKSFSQMAQFWPTANGPAAKAMNEIPKIVFSRKGFDPLRTTTAKGWSDAQVLTGDLSEEIAALKKQSGKDLLAHGGIEFAQSLIQTGLIDEFWIASHPVAAGSGLNLFEKLSEPLYLKLIDTKVFSTGAMIHIYQPEWR
jgi:dihydrofolate reductase